jgi:hypothetical protein
MAAGRIIEVANFVVAALNADVAALDESGDPISPPLFEADRSYYAEYTNVQLATLQVDVRHPAVVTAEESRDGTEDTYGIEIALQQTVNRTDQAAIDALVTLARRAARTFPVAAVMAVAGSDPDLLDVQVAENVHLVFDPDKLAGNRFYSSISLAIKEYAPNAANAQ